MTVAVETLSDHLKALRHLVLTMPMAQTLQMEFLRLEPGHVTLQMPVLPGFCFRPNQLQATAIFAVADFAAVAAAGTLLAPGFMNSTIDANLKILAPALGTHMRAHGRVIHESRLLTTCTSEVFAIYEGRETLCASLVATARNIDMTPKPKA
jgi:acyl-coenzyme A thioesterase PaaI-like protein